MKKLFNTPFFIIIFFACYAFAINQLNIAFVNEHFVGNILNGGAMYAGPDDHNYVDAAKNFVKGLGYTIDPQNDNLKVRRTPGYSIFFGIHYYFFGEDNVYQYLKISQCLLFGLSVWLLNQIILFLGYSPQIAKLGMLIYGWSPFIPGALFNTITEAIHPECIIVYVYFFYLALNKKNSLLYFILAGGIGAFTFMVRPTNIVVVFVFSLYMLYVVFKKEINFKFLLVYTSGIMLIWTPWIVRNYLVKKEFIPLEKYYNSPMNYGVMQMSISKLWMTWANPHPEKLCGAIVSERNQIDKYKSINAFVTSMPSHLKEDINVAHLKQTLYQVSNCYEELINKRGGLTIYKYKEKVMPCDSVLQYKIGLIADSIYAHNFFYTRLYVPLIVRGKEFVFHSFSSGYPYLNFKVNGKLNKIQIVIKATMYLLNVLYFVAFFLILYKIKENLIPLWLSIFITFLIYVQIYHIEVRYLLGCYAFFPIFISILLNNVRQDKS